MTLGADGAGSAASGGAPELLEDAAPRVAAPVEGGDMHVPNTIAARLRSSLERIVEQASELARGLGVRRLERDLGTAVVMSGADFHFEKPSAAQQDAQLELKRRYEPFSEVVRVLLRAAPERLVSDWRKADKKFKSAWIELGTNYTLSADEARNEAALRKDADALAQVLSVLEGIGTTGVLLVPDTNSLVDQPDPVMYRPIAGRDDFTLVLLPPVLDEIDDLKIAHKNPDVRDGAMRAITRIKGWRDQARRAGRTLNDGTVVDGSITVQSLHIEPDVKGSLSWLDASVADDRIIAAVLAVAAEHPAARVVLVTGDVNLQNKADAAMLETADTP
ncbi:PIN domain-containing protein [Anaeromyxobacter oryzisoli]|uniref:PIN domain-containing protein n=1 Tax=Anaeromyxobacter oryzisoli TaxID=2925408 RepID=UPI001F5A6FF0|nr:PIN domain-containing protein [Anaeromyxobacter sp. SG63]